MRASRLAGLVFASTLRAEVVVSWESPGKDPSGSMPLGNGGIGVNLWVETSGIIAFDLSKADAWDENLNPLNLGRVRLRLTPDPLNERPVIPFATAFRQDLRTADGFIDIGLPNARVSAWVDAYRPVVHVEVDSALPRTLEVLLDTTNTLVPNQRSRITWYHRNRRISGAAIQAEGLVTRSPGILQSVKPRKRYRVSVHLLTAQTAARRPWMDALDRQILETNRAPIVEARTAHVAWWRRFWQRSYVEIEGDAQVESTATDQQKVTRGYALQRYFNACAVRGVNWLRDSSSPYWTMLGTGDADRMQALFGINEQLQPLLRETLRRDADGALDLSALMLDYSDFTGRKLSLALTDSLLHHQTNQATAAQWGYVLPRLIGSAGEPRRSGYQRMLDALPSVPAPAAPAIYQGIAGQARDYVVSTFTQLRDDSRFPLFPQPAGDLAMIVLQKMLVKIEGDEVHWLPGWPKDWNTVRFRVFLPGKRVAEGEIRGGVPGRMKIVAADQN